MSLWLQLNCHFLCRSQICCLIAIDQKTMLWSNDAPFTPHNFLVPLICSYRVYLSMGKIMIFISFFIVNCLLYGFSGFIKKYKIIISIYSSADFTVHWFWVFPIWCLLQNRLIFTYRYQRHVFIRRGVFSKGLKQKCHLFQRMNTAI